MTVGAGPRFPIRVAILSDALPGRSGVGTYYDDLHEHLLDRVEAVRVLSPSPQRPRPPFPWSAPLPGDPTQRLYLPEPRRSWQALKALAPHVVVVATPGPFGALGMAAAHHMNAGLCVVVHTRFDDLVGLYWNRWMAAGATALVRSWESLVCRRADAVLVNNGELLERVRREGVHAVRLVGTPVPRQFLDEPASPFRDAIGCVCFIGRLAEEKRIDLVLAAARALPDIRFLIAGDGPLRGEVEAAVGSNVEYLGWLDRAGVRATLDRADLLLLPSRYETFGTIALEALSRGTPAVVSSECGIARWEGIAPGLIPMFEGESVLAALRRIRAAGHAARAETAARGRRVAALFTDRTIADWLRILESVRRPGVRA